MLSAVLTVSPFAPLLAPLVTGVALLLLWGAPRAQRAVSVTGALAHTALALAQVGAVRERGVLAAFAGDWPAPFGIVFAVDMLGALLVAVTAVLGLASAVFAVATVEGETEHGGFHPLLHLLLFGVTGAFSTGDLFNLYVWFEVLLISSFVLLSLGRGAARLEGTLKYVTLNLLSSFLFLAATGLAYGFYGALNFAELAVAVRNYAGEFDPAPLLMALLMAAFAIKAGLFPFHAWLPASYPLPHPAVSAVLSGLLTKVGVYALIRLLTLVFSVEAVEQQTLILGLAGVTMSLGVLGALAQPSVRGVLSFHIVSQIGYMILGLGVGTLLGLAGAVFYMVHHMLVKANLFLIGGALELERGTGRLSRLGGLAGARPALAALFVISAFSLAGLPPFSGFFAKLVLLRASFEAGHPVMAAVALTTGLFTLLSMMKIWNEAFAKPAPEGSPTMAPQGSPWGVLAPAALLAGFSIALGVWAEPLLGLCRQAAADLLDPARYLDAVLGARAGGAP